MSSIKKKDNSSCNPFETRSKNIDIEVDYNEEHSPHFKNLSQSLD